MIIVPLQPIPAQTLTIVLDDVQWGITLRSVQGGVLAADFDRGGVRVVSGVRCLSSVVLIPWRSIEAGGGNFVFDTPAFAFPDWQHFGDTHTLYYASAAELAEARK